MLIVTKSQFLESITTRLGAKRVQTFDAKAPNPTLTTLT